MRCGHSLTGSKVVELHAVAISNLSSVLDRKRGSVVGLSTHATIRPSIMMRASSLTSNGNLL